MTRAPDIDQIAADAPRLNLRQVAKQATRQRALTAAEALFKASGYAEATIRSIAQTMGMSTGAIFANFESKAELWTAIFGGPPPEPRVADEIARILGELPDHDWSLRRRRGAFHATITGPDYDPVTEEGPCFTAQSDTAGDALRAARQAALDAHRTAAATRPLAVAA